MEMKEERKQYRISWAILTILFLLLLIQNFDYEHKIELYAKELVYENQSLNNLILVTNNNAVQNLILTSYIRNELTINQTESQINKIQEKISITSDDLKIYYSYRNSNLKYPVYNDIVLPLLILIFAIWQINTIILIALEIICFISFIIKLFRYKKKII